MKKEVEKKLVRLVKNIKDSNKLIKELENDFTIKEAKKFGTGSHICLLKKNIGTKFLIIKIPKYTTNQCYFSIVVLEPKYL